MKSLRAVALFLGVLLTASSIALGAVSSAQAAAPTSLPEAGATLSDYLPGATHVGFVGTFRTSQVGALTAGSDVVTLQAPAGYTFPEPSTIALALSALVPIGVVGLRRIRRRPETTVG